jgi:hypothetical protein
MRRESNGIQAGSGSGAEVAIARAKSYTFDMAVKAAMNDLIAADRLRKTIAARGDKCTSCSEFFKKATSEKLATIEARLAATSSRVVRIAKRNLPPQP